MDNATCHIRRVEPLPVKSWTNKRMIEWLQVKGVQYPTKPLNLISLPSYKGKSLYCSICSGRNGSSWRQVHVALKQFVLKKWMNCFEGHKVVRLPVAHCTLNPIELAWAQVKGHIKLNTKKFNLNEVELLAWEGFATVTADHWKKPVMHVLEKVEDYYWSCDGLYEHYTSKLYNSVRWRKWYWRFWWWVEFRRLGQWHWNWK